MGELRGAVNRNLAGRREFTHVGPMLTAKGKPMRKLTVLVIATLLAATSGVAAASAKAHRAHSAVVRHKRTAKSPAGRPITHVPVVSPDAYRA